MRKGLTLGLLITLLGLVAWWMRSERGESPALEPAGAPVATPPLDPEPELEARTPMEPGETRELAREAPDPLPPAASDAAQPAPPEVVDREERRELVIHVHDTHGNPVHSAKVRATGTRTVQSPGAWHSWRDSTLVGETDVEGTARLTYPVFLGGTGGGWNDVRVVCFSVTHPDFVRADLEAEVAPGEHRVVLEQGTLVIVSGWIDSRSNRIEEVHPRVSHDVDLAGDAWNKTDDGRPMCSSMPPGTHRIQLEHERDGLTWHSAAEEFTVAEGGQLELHLELIAPRPLAGVLDPAVPRPIVDGAVLIHTYVGERGQSGILSSSSTAEVTPAGAFQFAGIRHGAAEIIGICEGWSALMLGADGDEAQEIPAEFDGPFVLRMQPTAALEVEVTDADGAAITGAQVYTWPNVHWRIGYSTMFMNRQWVAVTDAGGRARIENLPPGLDEGLVVKAVGYRMPMATSSWGNEQRHAWTDFVSGETAQLSVQLEPAED